MYRVIKLSGKWYGAKLEGSEIYNLSDDDMDAIDSFISQGDPVLLGDDKEGMEDTVGTEIQWV